MLRVGLGLLLWSSCCGVLFAVSSQRSTCIKDLHVHADAAAGDDDNVWRIIAAASAGDNGIGELARPDAAGTVAVRSIHAAQSVVRTHRKRCPSSQITVHLAGSFELPAPLVLGPEDSGTADEPVVWRAAEGASPVLSGGVSISGWTKGCLLYTSPSPRDS